MRPASRLLPFLAMAVTCGAAAPAAAEGLGGKKAITQLSHTSWSAGDGIPGPVRALAQTTDGYLWFGTEAGLYRFDGVRFVATGLDGGARAHGLAVVSLLGARDGSLWVGFGSGGIAHLRRGDVTQYPSGDGVPGGSILSIAEDGRGAIWAAGQYGLARFAEGRWRRVGADMGYAPPGAQSLLVDGAGTLWVVTDGLDMPSTSSILKNTIFSLADGAARFAPTGETVGMIWSMAEGRDGRVWVADTSSSRVRRIGDPRGGVAVDGEPLCVAFGGDGSVWAGLNAAGLRRAREIDAGGALDELGVKDHLSGSSVYAALKDREGNLWFGTSGGLDRFVDTKFTPFSEIEGVLADRPMALASTPDGSVWLAGYTGDTVWRFRDGTLDSYPLAPYSKSDTTRILSLFASAAGEVWIGGSFKLARHDRGGFGYVDIPDLLEQSTVEAIGQDTGGDLWVTTTGGDGIGRVLRRHGGGWIDVRAHAELPPYRSRVLHGDRSGRMWLGFENGEVAAFAGAGPRVYSRADGLVGGRILAIADDRDGHILVGSDGGLSRLEQDRFATLTEENGLPGGSVSGILEDTDGGVWIAGVLGIIRVAPEELARAFASPSYRIAGTLFDARDGLRGLPRQRQPFPTAARGKDGLLWFATAGGVAAIDPRAYPRNTLPPPVHVEAIVADARPVAATAPLRLPSSTKTLEFQYSALSLSAPERVRFRTQLEGYDSGWRGPTSARNATYTNLPSGSYRFRVIACNNDGIWNETGAAIEISVLPAYYQTRSFLVFCVAVASGLLWAAYRLRLGQLRARLELQFRERLAERTRIAQELHDTLLQGFLSASLQLQVAVDQVTAESQARPLFDRVLALMRAVVDEGRNAVRGLRSSTSRDDLDKALARVGEDVDPERAVDFHVVRTGQPVELVPFVRDDVYRICREAVVNAFRHARAARIEVAVEFASDGLRVVVRDDGCGMEPELAQGGRAGHFGLVGMRERATAIGGRLKLWSRDGGGTEVELFVPSRVAFRRPQRGWPARPSTRPAGEPDARR